MAIHGHTAQIRKKPNQIRGDGRNSPLRTNDEQIYQNEDSLYGAAVKPGTRSSQQCETCCELAEHAGRTIPLCAIQGSVPSHTSASLSSMPCSAVICPTPSVAKEIHVL